MASVQMLRSTGSSVANVCALTAPAPGAATRTIAASRARFIADSISTVDFQEQKENGPMRGHGKGRRAPAGAIDYIGRATPMARDQTETSMKNLIHLLCPALLLAGCAPPGTD